MTDATDIKALLATSQAGSYIQRLRREDAELQAERETEAASITFEPRAKLKKPLAEAHRDVEVLKVVFRVAR